MSKIADLVPPWELCREIPEGEFEDTVFLWGEATVNGENRVYLIQRYSYACKHPEWEKLYPAPTLQEVMAAFPYCRVYKKTHNFYIAAVDQEREVSFDAATAALKLWLKLKGIKYEK